MEQVLARLDRLEAEQRKLLEEIAALRRELAPSSTPVSERLDVLETRAAETDQAKVQAAQRFPVTLAGMALFNAFVNGPNGGGSQDPTSASLASGPRNSGAGFRQTTIGLRYDGPGSVWGAKVSGALDMDLWGGDSNSLNHLLRLRTATVRLDWARSSVSFGQDKPLIAPRDPDSLAQVALSPLTGAGNPWLWQPQARVEQRIALNESSGITLQGSLYQTRESYSNLPLFYQNLTAAARPGWEGRAQYSKHWTNDRKLELATGFHTSFSRVAGTSIQADAVSFDWLIDPLPRWEITGAFYRGQNLGTIGGGAGISLLSNNSLAPIHQDCGWLQSSFRVTPRLKVNAFVGDQSERTSDLRTGALRENLALGGNLMYRIAPNVIASIEAMRLRTNYFNSGIRTNIHYDLALAYLF
jgi:hypothetical protein